MLRVTGSFGINQDCESMTTVSPTREASVFLRSYHTFLLSHPFSFHLSFSHSFFTLDFIVILSFSFTSFLHIVFFFFQNICSFHDHGRPVWLGSSPPFVYLFWYTSCTIRANFLSSFEAAIGAGKTRLVITSHRLEWRSDSILCLRGPAHIGVFRFTGKGGDFELFRIAQGTKSVLIG